MIFFFKTPQQSVIATQVDHQLTQTEVQELCLRIGLDSDESGSIRRQDSKTRNNYCYYKEEEGNYQEKEVVSTLR